MLELIKDIKKALEAECFRCALGLALSLPDICGQIEFPNEKFVGERYRNWCDKYLFNQGFVTSSNIDYSKKTENWDKVRVMSGDTCYKLRCAYLHSGNLELNQRKNDHYPDFELRICAKADIGIYIEPYIEDDNNSNISFALDLRHLCKVLCNSAEEYYHLHNPKSDFESHEFIVIDVEAGASKNQKWKDILNEHQTTKKNIFDISELSEIAKNLLQKINERKTDNILKELESDKDVEIIAATIELIQGGFIQMSL